MKEAGRKQNRFRLIIQLASAALLNGYVAGFAKGKIFTGPGKAVCVPVLNCYACPGALGACPIGSLQTVLGRDRHRFSFYVLGMLMVFGIALGRLWCGFVCPFGLIQDLLYRIPTKKVTVPRKADQPLRYVKYAILAVFVILLPVCVNKPFFCQFICPAGTLQGGIPLMLAESALRKLAGALFSWKMLVLLLVLISAVLIPRSFCRYLCPLGAFYAVFNRFSFYQMTIDQARCTGCNTCARVCPMATTVSSAECIRCGRCKAACPTGSIRAGISICLDSEKQL